MLYNERIRKVREAHNLHQTEVAKEIGCIPSYISHMESGKREPSVEIIKLYVYHFGVDPLWLLFEIGDMLLDEERYNLVRKRKPAKKNHLSPESE